MKEKLVSEKEALVRIYQTINGPVKAGKKWVTYERPVIDSVLKVLKEIIEKKK